MVIVLLTNIIIWFFFIIKKEKVFLWIPVIYLIIRFLFPLLTDVSSDNNFAYSRSAVLLNWSEIFFTLFVSLYIIVVNKKYVKNWGLFAILIYFLFLLIAFASDKEISLKNFIVFSRTVLLLPAAFVYFSKNLSKEQFFKMIVVLNILATIYIIYCSLFKIGNDFYGSNIIYLGGLQMLGAYLFVYSLPVFLWGLIEFKKKKIIIYISIFFAIIIPVLIFKRTFIFIEIFILLLYFVLFGIKFKYFFRSIIMVIVIFSGLYIFRSDINKMIYIRHNRIETEITAEGRFLEYKIIWAEQIKGNNIKKLIFGNELFNNKNDFGKKISFGLNTSNRFFHSEITEIIYSTGLIGTILYFWFLFLVFKEIFKKSKNINNPEFKKIIFLFLSVFLVFIINGFVEQWCTYFARAFPLFILGFVFAIKNSMLKKI